jgi:hypothetical protein
MLRALRHIVGIGSPIPRDEVEWQLACFDWLLRGTGGFGRFRHAVLVLPADEHFPQRGLRSGALEQALFKQVKEHAGMASWRCSLEIQRADPNPVVAPAVVIQGRQHSPLGTFRRDGKRVVITYRADSMLDPVAFVATLAHELGHYLIARIREPPPGGHANLEFATDMAAVFLGFGVFMANSAFTFSQYHGGGVQGWSAGRHGYLTESQLVHACALFTTLLALKPARAVPHLDPHLRRPYKSTCARLRRAEGMLERLRAIPPGHAPTRDIVAVRAPSAEER